MRKDARKSFWARLGPGLITGIADDDPSGIGTYSIAGAQFGLGLLWFTALCVPLMIAVQEMCGRIAAITGKGLAAVLREYYPKPVLWTAVVLLAMANTFNVWADLNAMAASVKMVCGGSLVFWLTATTAVTLALEVFVPYRSYVRYLKWLCLTLGAYVITALLPTLHVPWSQVLRREFVPSWSSDPAYLITAVGFLGTTISPYLFFWQASETVEEEVLSGRSLGPGRRIVPVTEGEIQIIRQDTAIGMAASQVITFFIIVCTAVTLHARGLTHIATAQDAARALLPLGRSAYLLFTLGIIGAGLLGVPTLAGSVAYAVSETLGWKSGLYRRFDRARGFYLILAAVLLVGYAMNFARSVSPITALLYAAVLNGVVAPPLIVLLLVICNNRRIVGDRRNTWLANLFGGLAAALMALAAGLMAWSMVRG